MQLLLYGMPNRPRPKCPKCGRALEPAYRKTSRGGTTRIPDVFWCEDDGVLARGRKRTRYVT